MSTGAKESRRGRFPALPPAFESYAEESLEQAPAGGPGKNGLLEATLARAGTNNQTRLVRDHVIVPYHLTGTLETDPVPGLTTLIAQEPTGGVAQGDRHRMEIDARSGARANVTTQSATKVHSMRANYAHLDATLEAKSGSYLEYVPGPTIVNEDARCLQTVRVDLEDDAIVLVGDVLVPDGLSEHESFDFDHYHARVEAEHDGKLVCADTVDIRPDERDPRDSTSVGEYDVIGSLYVFAPDRDSEALTDRIHDRLEETPRGEAQPRREKSMRADETEGRGDALDSTLVGVSTLPHEVGVVVRVLGYRQLDVTNAIRDAWDETRLAFFEVGIPADRRY
ncbi:urease accessory protein UreD [Halostagnicola sp. A-GB9-2]|uniref:urease accessory protein UreD n=1 Tax=Halostagnicola sp. A-GB9-2 TaxID=3048066 RepID=UPI0024C092A4|nr:urease accessory protein UreD [Halostagnicola sp. A-GB9-2]MDJ1430479.1 urease accessory protein UreD [Halostagnicola sp. A-GB9-2]